MGADGPPGRLDVAAYLTADQHATQYRVIVDALLDAQEHSLTGVGRDELLDRVRGRVAAVADLATAERLTLPDEFDLEARMRTLHAWGVVIRWQDKAKTEADFVRTRDRYQLTAAAADLHRWLRRKIDEDAVATSAAAFAPAVIADRLDEMLLALADADHLLAAQAWAQVRTTLADMAEAAAVWQSRMASALAGAPDTDKMRHLRETILAYITVWGAGVDTYSPRIRGAIERFAYVTDHDWRALALAGVDVDASEDVVEAIVAGHRDLAELLRGWFAGRDAQSQRLRRQVRDAVAPLLRGSRALLSSGGSVTRRAELLRVAAAVESAPSNAEAWRVWCAATGVWAARHLPGRPPEPADSPPRTSFWVAPPVPVELTLRKRGAKSVRGRVAQVPDRRAARRAAREGAAADRAASKVAEQAVAARSGLHLSQWTALTSRAEAALVWELLAAVLRQPPDSEGVRLAYSRDARLRVVAFPAPPDQRSAVLILPDGRIACENWRLDVTAA
ncbi:DUF2397 domain-containing protein [Dactylosporangium darangshiense]|uniref:DUF2397 domain-containing protein n=1 Tax=Dactylosporangium darangshiense TaxID=579108 RepID=UPI003636D7D1